MIHVKSKIAIICNKIIFYNNNNFFIGYRRQHARQLVAPPKENRVGEINLPFEDNPEIILDNRIEDIENEVEDEGFIDSIFGDGAQSRIGKDFAQISQCSRNFQNVKLRLDFDHFTATPILREIKLWRIQMVQIC